MAKGKFGKWITLDGLALVEGWAHDGLTDEQIAHNIGISKTTLYSWESRFPDFLDSIKKGKKVADYMVENALFRRATGYTTVEHQYKVVDVNAAILAANRRKVENIYKLDHPEATEQEIKDYAVEQVPARESIELFQNKKEVAPDTTAQIFWLKNRKPGAWRDRKEIEHSGGVSITPFDGMSTDELEKHLDQLEDDDSASDE